MSAQSVDPIIVSRILVQKGELVGSIKLNTFLMQTATGCVRVVPCQKMFLHTIAVLKVSSTMFHPVYTFPEVAGNAIIEQDGCEVTTDLDQFTTYTVHLSDPAEEDMWFKVYVSHTSENIDRATA